MSDSKSVKRTKLAIEKAFFDLLKTKQFDEITLSEIIEESGYSRATFYKYYSDKYDFAEKVFIDEMNRFMEAIKQNVKANSPANDEESVYNMLYGIYCYVEKKQNFFSAVIYEKIPSYTILEASDFLYKILPENIEIHDYNLYDDVGPDFFYFLNAHETMLTIRYWAFSDYIQSIEDITKVSMLSYQRLGYYSLGIKE